LKPTKLVLLLIVFRRKKTKLLVLYKLLFTSKRLLKKIFKKLLTSKPEKTSDKQHNWRPKLNCYYRKLVEPL
jgi:hypothetical protein